MKKNKKNWAICMGRRTGGGFEDGERGRITDDKKRGKIRMYELLTI